MPSRIFPPKTSNSLRRVLLSLAAAALIALGLRVASEQTAIAASATTCLALGACAVGLWLHCRRHTTAWRAAWALLAVALVIETLEVTHAAVNGLPKTYPAATDWASAVCALVAAIAVGILLSTRARGRAIDAMLEGATIAAALTYVAWLWGVGRGVDDGHALAALLT